VFETPLHAKSFQLQSLAMLQWLLVAGKYLLKFL
jgi:hypothetical protein